MAITFDENKRQMKRKNPSARGFVRLDTLVNHSADHWFLLPDVDVCRILKVKMRIDNTFSSGPPINGTIYEQVRSLVAKVGRTFGIGCGFTRRNSDKLRYAIP